MHGNHTLVEACVVIAAVQPSPTLTVHEIVSPCKGARSTRNRQTTPTTAEPQVPSEWRSCNRELKGGGPGLTETMPPP
jgi:hypothetical protein